MRIRVGLISALGVAMIAAPSFAKSHCVATDGTEVSGAMTKKDCKSKGGTWKKEASTSTKTKSKKTT
jgi:hypothetical protein